MIKYIVLILFNVSVAYGCICSESCINKEELGRGTWFLLHEMVKHEQSPEVFKEFMNTLSKLYPCSECRTHMQEYFDANGVDMSEKWMCLFHNSVNKRLNKRVQYLCF
jgi:hypothetical protein